jgi:peptide/nickel transport system substrate-binding protein
MDEQHIRHLVSDVKAGRMSRRAFTRALIGVGLTAPFAAQILSSAGVATAQTRGAYAPTRRGGGGQLKVLWWQAPTLLQPHFANGTKDQDGSRIFYEPLASYDPEGNLLPVLAAEIPSVQNGGVSRDGTSVTWKLKRGVTWHDGKPFTADDIVFNWEYAADPATAAVTSGAYTDIARIDKVDSHTAKITFKKPTPFWSDAFCGASRGQVIPKHLFEAYKGGKSREAPNNTKPVGTGPYKLVDFKPGDTIRAELFSGYHGANRPHFDSLELKGGGDATSAARAVLQTGEYDFAWNMQVEEEVLKRLEKGGRGRVEVAAGGNIEHIQLNQADPWKDVDGERASMKTTHPFLTDPAVRGALNVLVDRASIHEEIYGRGGQSTANFLNAPARFHSKNNKWEFSVEKASQLLDAGGWKRGGDGVRVKDGKRLKVVFQTSINAPRQKTQAIIKQACSRAGIEVEVKAIVASVFFSSDAGNPDTFPHFYSDLQMYNTTMGAPDPQFFMNQFTSWEIASAANKFAGRNPTRWRNEEYDRLYRASEVEMDPVKRAANFIRMNDMVIKDVVVIPVLWRNVLSAASVKMKGSEISGWDSNFWNLANWYREG